MKFELFVGWRYLRKRKKNYFLSAVTVIAVLGVAVSVMTVIVVLAVMNGFRKELEEKITGNIAPIVVEGYGGISDYKDIISRVEALEGITGAGAFVMRQGLLSHRSEVSAVTFMGIDPEAYDRIAGLSGKIISGDFNLRNTEAAHGVLVGAKLAEKTGLMAGSIIQCMGAGEAAGNKKSALFVKECAVRGIFETGMYEYDTSLVYMLLGPAQELFMTGGRADGIEVRVDDIYSSDEIARVIEDVLGAGFIAVSWMERHRNLFAALALEKKTMVVILALIVVVAAFNIMSTLVMLVMEKTKDIGILKAIGAGKDSIMKIFILEGILIGFSGVILGAGGGFLLCAFLDRYPLIHIPGEIYLIDKLPVSMSVYDFVFIAVLAFIVSVAAAIYPAAKASSLSPVEALRYE